MRTIVALFLMIIVLAAPLTAQDGQAEMPVDQKQLDLFLGDWEGPGSYEGEGVKLSFDMTFTGEHIIGGQAIEINPQADVPNMGPYREKSLIAWDSMTKHVTMLTVSNMGEVGCYTGSWVKGKKNTLELSQTKIVDNDAWKTETTIFFHDGNKMTWKVLSTKNDKAAGTFEATLTRK